MKQLHIFTIFLFLSAVAVPRASVAFAEETVLLQSLIEEAQKNNPELTLLRLHQEGTKEEINSAASLDDPQLTITQWGIPRDLNIGRSDQTWLGIEQSFPYPGKRHLKQEIATFDWEITKQEYQAKQLEVTAAIKWEYYGLSLIYKMIDLYQEHQVLLAEFIKVAEKRYISGQATQQDLLKAELELAKLHNNRITLDQDLVAAKTKINALLNRSDSFPIGRPETLHYRPFLFLYDTLTEEALNLRPELKGTLLYVKKSEAMEALTNKAMLPDFMVGLSYMNMHNGEDLWMAMGKMNLPWVFGEKYNSKNRKSVLDKDTAKASYNAVKNETLSQIKTIFIKIKTDEKLMDTYQNRLIPLAKQSLSAARIGYQSGKTDFLNFIESERTLLDMEMEYQMKLSDYWQQVAMLSPLIGKEIIP